MECYSAAIARSLLAPQSGAIREECIREVYLQVDVPQICKVSRSTSKSPQVPKSPLGNVLWGAEENSEAKQKLQMDQNQATT